MEHYCEIVVVTTEYFHERHNNGNSEHRQHFDYTFRLYLVIRNNYVTSASAYIDTLLTFLPKSFFAKTQKIVLKSFKTCILLKVFFTIRTKPKTNKTHNFTYATICLNYIKTDIGRYIVLQTRDRQFYVSLGFTL